MADDEDAPDFGYAYAGTTHWNPAFRPDHHASQKSLDATEIEHPPHLKVENEDEDASQENDQLDDLPPSKLSMPSTNQDARRPSEVDWFDRYGPYEEPPSLVPDAAAAPAPQAQNHNVREAWDAIHEAPTATPLGEPEVELHVQPEDEKEQPVVEPIRERAPEPTSEVLAEEPLSFHDEQDTEFESKPDFEHPEQTYEHQGETILEHSVQEDPEASLLANAETPAIETPAVEWGPEEQWGIGEQAEAAVDSEPEIVSVEEPVSEPQVAHVEEASQEPQVTHIEEVVPKPTVAVVEPKGTIPDVKTVAASPPDLEPVAPLTVAPKEPELNWEDSGEVDFNFGALTSTHGDDFSAGPGDQLPSTSVGGPPGDDLTALWSSLADDDELLPEETAAAFAFDDNEGFLEDSAAQQSAGLDTFDTSQKTTKPAHSRASSSKYAPPSAQTPVSTTPSNPYFPQGPQFTDISQQSQAPATKRGPVASPYAAAYQPPQPERPRLVSGESFADKAKGGYHSPYDLPDDLTVHRRRPVQHHKPPSPALPQGQPPPRSSSMKGSPISGTSRPQPPLSSMSARSFTPPSSSHSIQPPNTVFAQTGPGVTPNLKTARKNSNEFFADLPFVQRPVRHATPSGRYTPNVQAVPTPPPGPLQPSLNRPASYATPPQAYPAAAQQALSSVPGTQLQAPARLPPYAEDPSLTRPSTTSPSAPPPSSRYSPAVPPTSIGIRSTSFPASAPIVAPISAPPPAASRYSPVPPPAPGTNPRYTSQSGPPSRTQSQQYAPRTSSPLAYHTMPQEHHQPSHPQQTVSPSMPGDADHHQQDGAPPGRPSFDRGVSLPAQQYHLEPVAENEPYGTVETSQSENQRYPASTSTPRTATPPPSSTRSGPPSSVSSPRKKTNYAPQSYQPAAQATEPPFAPPRRSQTSSPGAALKHPRLAMTNFDRPASAHGPISPKVATAHLNTTQSAPRQPAYEESTLAVPQDERAHDPLQRWKGSPIIHWGVGKSVVTSFPQYVPRYGSGHVGPMIKPTQDTIQIRSVNEIYPHSDTLAKFPGPLRKGKKKEVLAWLKTSTENLQSANQQLVLNGMLPAAVHTQREERLLLWKVMTLIIENDGVLDGKPAVDEAVRKLIAPSAASDNSAAETFGVTQAPPINALPEAFDPAALNVLRNHLYQGEREKAVWHAADQRLWAHALLIASTLNNKDLWKQVVQEFVRKEIRKIGDNTEALGALYQVFAGNWEESIDELVSVSARHGFNMVSTSTANATPSQKDALAGLDRWRETLLLILNNRSSGDAQALVALGKLLSGFGRAEAAHVCFLFAKNAAIFSGAEDPNSHFSLIGGLPSTQGLDFGDDLDTILLSEVYEFSFTLGPVTIPPIPHLQAYKLYHAQVLAEMGRQTEAQQYTDAIASIITSKSYRSPYYNKQLMGWVDELNQRLSQAPADSTSSWKPSMDRVSTSLWGKFNNFIAGEDSDAASTGSGNPPPAEGGQFARLAGETPPMSRAVSMADMYGAYQPNGSAVPAVPSNSRYAPSNNAYVPRTSSEQQRPRYDPQAQSAYQPRTSGESTRSTYDPRQSSEVGHTLQRAASSSTYLPSSAPAPFGSGQPPAQAVFSPNGSETHLTSSPYAGSPYHGTPPNEAATHSPAYHPPPVDHHEATNGYQPTLPQAPSTFESPADTPGYGYEPPSSGYEPPSYQPYQEETKPWDADEPDSPAEEKKPKKKSFMDDDDDDEFIRRAAQLKAQPRSSSKSDADKAADEAFRKAAEADGNYVFVFIP
jgi:hypothetical protein